MTNEIVEYQADNGQNIALSEQDVRDLLAAYGSRAENVTTQEIKAFLRLCQAQRLNPFTKDAYLVKYGSSPASVIAGKETFTKRAQRNPNYKGHEAGITILGTDGKLHRREGSMKLQGETIVGGWCKVHVKGYECPIFDEVAFDEYSAPDQYGKNGWSKMPATMIRKVALCHALREAFPEDLGGLYGAEEMDQSRAKEQAYSAPQEVETVTEYEPIYEPETTQNDVEIESEIVTETTPEDPRKTLWNEVADLKLRALELGTKEGGITSWMQANITQDDGTPKPPNHYTQEDILKLRDHLMANIADQEKLQSEQPVLLEEDIAF